MHSYTISSFSFVLENGKFKYLNLSLTLLHSLSTFHTKYNGETNVHVHGGYNSVTFHTLF